MVTAIDRKPRQVDDRSGIFQFTSPVAECAPVPRHFLNAARRGLRRTRENGYRIAALLKIRGQRAPQETRTAGENDFFHFEFFTAFPKRLVENVLVRPDDNNECRAG